MNSLTAIERELNPFPFYERMRTTAPVYFDPQRDNWHIFAYEDVQRVLSDYRIFSSQFRENREMSTSDLFSSSMISSDPPRHRKLRSLVTQAFTPKAVEALTPRISAIVEDHLDRIMSGGQFDVIRDLAYPLPVIVIAELLGIPTTDQERFKKWSDSVVSIAEFRSRSQMREMSGLGQYSSAVVEMGAYFMNMIEQRRNQPGDDLISGLLAADLDGEHLSLPDLLGFCALLLVAGNETTTNLIGNAMWCFSDHPQDWECLRASPELLTSAIEEVLRYRSPVQSMFRRATQEVLLEDQVIPQGARIVAWIGSANHDPAQFPYPEQFDIERTPNRHLAFGQGIHYCLGAPLARLEARIALKAMLERFRSVRRLPGFELEQMPSLIVFGVRSLPLEFEIAT